MKKTYIVPEVIAYEVVAERGYQASSTNASFSLDNFTAEEDSWE